MTPESPSSGTRRRPRRPHDQGRDAVKLMVQPEAGLVPVVQAIRRAKRAVDIAIFRMNRLEVATALGAAVQRGVKVRALVAHRNAGGESRLRKLEQHLLELGVTVSRSSDDFVKYHGKYLIVDDTLYLLGFNFTKADTTRSRSFGVQTRDRRAVKDATRLFESDLNWKPYDGTGRSPLVVSPENARDALLRFVKGARRRLAIYDARLEDTAFITLIRQRSSAGVQVQVIGRASKLAAGTEVRMLRDLRLHVRAIIRDGTRAFVGSQSLRRLELDRRREVGLIITNPSVTRRMLDVFDQDWESSAPKDGDEKSADKAKSKADTDKDKKAKDDKGDNGKNDKKDKEKNDKKEKNGKKSPTEDKP